MIRTLLMTLCLCAALAVSPAFAKQENVYRVYFNVNETTLNDKNMDQVAAAAAAYKARKTEIILAGHTDRAGGDKVNEELSKARAVSVTAALVKMGVPREFIVTKYFGEAAPLVKTGDGVSSRDNRRVLMIVK